MNASTDASTLLLACRQHWLWPTRRRVVIGFAVAFALWGWFDVRNRGRIDPHHRSVHKTDFTVYTAAGAAFFDGRDPYTVENPRGWRYLYPPLLAILVSPLADLDTRNQVLVWFAISILLGWGCLRELARISRELLPDEPQTRVLGALPNWIAVAACTAAALPALNCLQRGQVGVAKLYFLLLGFRLIVARRSAIGAFAGGFVLAAPIALKVTPAVPVAVLLWQQLTSAWYARDRESRLPARACWPGTGAGLATFFLLVPAALVGWRANLTHLETWWSQVALRAESAANEDFAGDTTSVRNQSLVNAAHSLGNWMHYYLAGGPHDHGPMQLRHGGPGLLMDAPAAEAALVAVRAIAAALVIAVGFRMGRAQDKLGQAAAFGLACAATLVVFPIARTHYFVLLLPAVAFVSLWFARQGWMRFAVAMAVIPGALVITHYALLDVAGRVGLLGLGTTAWYLTAGVAMCRAQPSTARESCARATNVPAAQPLERAIAA